MMGDHCGDDLRDFRDTIHQMLAKCRYEQGTLGCVTRIIGHDVFGKITALGQRRAAAVTTANYSVDCCSCRVRRGGMRG
jgi:hypothetical protein